VNELETREDQDGKWRHYLNEQLQTGYRNLFAQLDLLLMLKAPDFDSVLRWRFEQELKLASIMSDTAKNKLMDRQTLIRFIQHYQRLTQHNNIEMPDRADVVLTLNRQHNVIEAHYKSQQDKHG
jgi:D-glycerate 3-kinase